MKLSTFHPLAVLVVAGLTAASEGAPTMAAPHHPITASQHTNVAPSQASLSSITVTVSCSPYAYNTYDCTATASGGVGPYTFDWQYSSTEYYEQGNTSKAIVSCSYGGGSDGHGGTYHYAYLAAVAVATDSQGQRNGAGYSGPYTCTP